MQRLLLVYYHSEHRATSQIWKILPTMVFPPIWREIWRRSEHTHASYPGLFFLPPGLSPFMGREERRVQGLDYLRDWITLPGILKYFALRYLSFLSFMIYQYKSIEGNNIFKTVVCLTLDCSNLEVMKSSMKLTNKGILNYQSIKLLRQW